MLPHLVTVIQIRSELCRHGYIVEERTLVSWRAKGVLPPLRSRGRGRRQGKLYFWRSPGIVDHALAVCRLRALKYPNDEIRLILGLAGFPVTPRSVHEAWLSCLGKLEFNLAKKRSKEIVRRGSDFPQIEDEISALTVGYVRELAAHFHLDQKEIAQLVIDFFGLIFRSGYWVDDEGVLDGLPSLFPFIKTRFKYLYRELQIQDALFEDHLRFITNYCSFAAVKAVVSSTTEAELRSGCRRWRAILRIFRDRLDQLCVDRELQTFIGAGFGRILVPVMMLLIQHGKVSQIDATIREVSHFCSRHDFIKIFDRLARDNRIDEADKLALAQLVGTLSIIWDHKGFPFSLSPS